MYILAAHIVAQKTGMSFTSYVETSLFKPLGMTSSTFSPMLDGQQSRDKLSGSFVRTGDGRVFEIPYGFDRSKEDLQFCAGAGGAVSCTSDMVKWVQALIVQVRQLDFGGNWPDSRLIKHGSYAASTSRKRGSGGASTRQCPEY